MLTRSHHTLCVVAGFAVLTLVGFAQPGFLDPTFDVGSLPPSEASSSVIAGLARPGGDVVLVRSGSSSGAIRGLTRILPDGRHDDAFGSAPEIDYAGFPSLVVEPEPGRLLFSGSVKPLRTLSQPFALNSQGQVITLYRPDPAFRGTPISAMVATREGGLFIGHRINSISEFNPDPPLVQQLDSGGQSVGFFRSALRGVGNVTALRSVGDGRLLVSGRLQQPGTHSRWSLVRLAPDGSLDLTYTEPELLRGRFVSGLSDGPDGDVLAWVGETLESQPERIVRLSADGSISPNQVTWDGRPDVGVIRSVLQDGDGLLVGGTTLIRLDATGRRDFASRLPALTGTTNRVNLLLRMADQSVMVGGQFSRVLGADGQLLRRPGYFRMTASGDVDLNFGRTGFETTVPQSTRRLNSLLLMEDGRVVVSGVWTHLDGSPSGPLCRLLPDGARDTSFPLNELRSPQSVMVAELGRGSLLVGLGLPFSFSNLPPVHLLRMDPAGSITAIPQPEGPVMALARTPDGSVVVAGQFDGRQDPAHGVVLRRLRTNGDWDPDWIVEPGIPKSDLQGRLLLRVLPDSRIVMGVPATGEIRRYLADGEVDASFEAHPAAPRKPSAPPLADLAVNDDGSMLAVGFGLESPTGPPVSALRWTESGALDRGFSLALSGQPTGVAAAGLGRFLLTGNLSLPRSGMLPGVIRILANGTLDPSFTTNMALGTVTGLTGVGTQAYGLATIAVRRENGTPKEWFQRLVRLDNSARSLLDPRPTAQGIQLRLVAPAGEAHVVESSENLTEWTPIAALVMPTNSFSEWILPRQLTGNHQFFRDRRLD